MTTKRVFVAGHKGMVGSAIVRKLESYKNVQVITCERQNLDLTNQADVDNFFTSNLIDEVYLAAAKVGGIQANNMFPADFIYENLQVQCNVINSAHNAGIQRLLFLGSSCIYPKQAEQPMKEEFLLTGTLERTNEPYAIAKIAGIKLCESYNRQHNRDYRSVMPTNLYGENDNFHAENSHVIPALIRRFHEARIKKARKVVAWGSGNPRREFMYVDDMADASIFVMNLDQAIYKKQSEDMLSHINLGSGVDCTIRELVESVAKVVGFQGEIEFDNSKPDGAPRKLMDVSKIRELGWEASTTLEEGLIRTYQWFLDNQDAYRR
ncbi:GDP-L-fucose synthase [Vibrio hepatarius]|uniref:GDP-L-fucose synthase n=1 Tax=Vibrio hepatarius TaxID=171383 RepID=UPI001C083055|nr:GDP-L-fucose synthase [Vibrio hepatarius]MBU2896885.1 GDP-L-fucose synthase [Vibrio hepatarius]